MAASYLNISFIGAGNVAWHLAQAFENAGHHIHEIYSRHPKTAQSLVDRLYSAEVSPDLDFSLSKANIFILAVHDDAITEVLPEVILPSPESIIVHTSGNTSLNVFQPEFENYGVFYPVQTISKSRKLDIKEIPFLIEASDKEIGALLLRLAQSISQRADYMSSEKRRQLHLSAVFASNFLNHLLSIAKKLSKRHQINFELLHPLIAETVNKSLELGPEKSQTGPAARGDLQTMDAHLALLEGDEDLKEIYKLLSQHILDQRYYEK